MAQQQYSQVCGDPSGEILVSVSDNKNIIIQRVVQLPECSDSDDDDAVYDGFNTLFIKPAFQSGHRAKITKVFFSPDPAFFFTVCNDKTIRKWTSQGDVVIQFEHASSTVTGASVSPDGRMLVSCAQSK